MQFIRSIDLKFYLCFLGPLSFNVQLQASSVFCGYPFQNMALHSVLQGTSFPYSLIWSPPASLMKFWARVEDYEESLILHERRKEKYHAPMEVVCHLERGLQPSKQHVKNSQLVHDKNNLDSLSADQKDDDANFPFIISIEVSNKMFKNSLIDLRTWFDVP